ncbi:acetylcholinesterase [Acrasis kona]|uniref:Acetylcholinesterase n=1 Tax=Acrasis kona TaxID=1008807 RepID=A0AAW2Z5A9_9EUKA
MHLVLIVLYLSLLASPKVEDNLFQSIILQNPWIQVKEKQSEESLRASDELFTKSGCNDLLCLQDLTANSLLQLSTNITFAPTIDGSFLKTSIEESIRSRDIKRKPIILGSTKYGDACKEYVHLPQNTTAEDAILELYKENGLLTTNQLLRYYDLMQEGSPKEALMTIYTDKMTHCPTRHMASSLSSLVPVYVYLLNVTLNTSQPCTLNGGRLTDTLLLFPESVRLGIIPGLKELTLSPELNHTSNQLVALWTNFAHFPRDVTHPFEKYEHSHQVELLIHNTNMSLIHERMNIVCDVWDYPNKQLIITVAVATSVLIVVLITLLLGFSVPKCVKILRNKKKSSPSPYEEIF